jgi:hypothetical protein
MLSHDVAAESHLAPEEIYISSSNADLIAVGMDAWKRGYDQAVEDGPAALRDLAEVERAGEEACDEALQVYIPMDLGRFRETYTLAWCGGYCTQVQESQERQTS